MMRSYLLILAFEIVIFYLVVYSLRKAHRWVNRNQQKVDDFSVDLPELLKDFRSELEEFNRKIKEKFTEKPLSAQELGILAGSIFSDIITAKIPFAPFRNRFVVFSVLMKLWKYRHRLKATVVNPL